MSKTAIWVVISFVGGAVVTSMLNAAGVDIYKGMKGKLKPKGLEILPSKRTPNVTVPVGYQGNVPHRMSIDLYFNVRNHNSTDTNIEDVNVAFSDTALPPTLLPLHYSDELQNIKAGATKTLKASFEVNIEPQQGYIEHVFNNFLQFLNAVPSDLGMLIEVAYMQNGKHETATAQLKSNAQQVMANNWLQFLKTQSIPNPDLQDFLADVHHQLEDMVAK